MTTETIQLQGGSGYGCKGWQAGQVVQAHPKRVAAGGPEWLYVVEAGRHYYAVDGEDFGVGADRGFAYWAHCRAASEAEAAPARAAQTLRETKTAATLRVAALKRLIHKYENFAQDGGAPPVGEALFDARTLGGDAFVITADSVWYLLGTAGWRVPATVELVAELRQLAEQIR